MSQSHVNRIPIVQESLWSEVLFLTAKCLLVKLGVMFYFSERNNMFGDDSRLSHLVKRITKESERERRLTAAQQFEEFLSTPDNYQVILMM